MSNKQLLRKEFIEIRKGIRLKNQKSSIIAEKILSLRCIKESKTVAVYNALPSEVETQQLIKGLFAIGKTVCLPRVSGCTMDFYRIKSADEKLIKGSFGVYEPPENKAEQMPPEKLDVIIIPGVCFDKKKNRIGFGKGYYDGYLSKNVSGKKIAVCFEEQILKNGFIDSDENDIRPDMIVTEKVIYG